MEIIREKVSAGLITPTHTNMHTPTYADSRER